MISFRDPSADKLKLHAIAPHFRPVFLHVMNTVLLRGLRRGSVDINFRGTYWLNIPIINLPKFLLRK